MDDKFSCRNNEGLLKVKDNHVRFTRNNEHVYSSKWQRDRQDENTIEHTELTETIKHTVRRR